MSVLNSVSFFAKVVNIWSCIYHIKRCVLVFWGVVIVFCKAILRLTVLYCFHLKLSFLSLRLPSSQPVNICSYQFDSSVYLPVKLFSWQSASLIFFFRLKFPFINLHLPFCCQSKFTFISLLLPYCCEFKFPFINLHLPFCCQSKFPFISLRLPYCCQFKFSPISYETQLSNNDHTVRRFTRYHTSRLFVNSLDTYSL